MEKNSVRNILGGQFQVSESLAVVSLLRYTPSISAAPQTCLVIETFQLGKLQVQSVTLSPKAKSSYGQIERKGLDVASLKALGVDTVQSWNISAAQLPALWASLQTQQTYQIYCQVTADAITYSCRSWLENKPLSAEQWYESVLKALGLKLGGRWQPCKLQVPQGIEVVPAEIGATVVTLPNSSGPYIRFFGSSSDSAESYCQTGQQFLKAKRYPEALRAFEQALALEANHEASQAGRLQVWECLGKAAYNQRQYEVALDYWQKMLAQAPNHPVARDGLEITQLKLNPALPARGANADVKRFPHPIENLVFQGGGIKGIAHAGALNELTEGGYLFDLASIKRVGGASAGAIFAMLLSLGFNVAELNELLEKTPFTEFFDGPYREPFLQLNDRQSEIADKFKSLTQGPLISVASKAGMAYASDDDIKYLKQGLNLLQEEDFGLFSGERLRQWLDEQIQLRTGGVRQADGSIQGGLVNATFKELADLKAQQPHRYAAFKALYVVCVNLTLSQIEVFSAETTPDVIVADAVRLSSSIPFVFRAHRLYIKNAQTGFRPEPDPKGHRYVDGGMLSNLPIWLFDKAKYLTQALQPGYQSNPHTLAFAMMDQANKNYYEGGPKPTHAVASSMLTYIKQVVDCIFDHSERQIPGEEHRERLIVIDHKGIKATEFALDNFQRDRLWQAGILAVRDYFVRLPQLVAKPQASMAPAYYSFIRPNVRDAQGNTALHTAVKLGDVALASFLCEYYGELLDKQVKNQAEQTVWDVVVALHHPQREALMQLLRRYQFEVAPVENQALVENAQPLRL